MKTNITLLSAVGLLAHLFASCAQAQNVTVQQPVIHTFSANTTISAPDRGSALLGGMSRAAAIRKYPGLFHRGSSFGVERSNATANVSVRIHDFAAMDEFLLNQGSRQTEHTFRDPTGSAQRAYQVLQRSHAQRSPVTPEPNDNQPQSSSRGERYYRLGLAAKQRGADGLARLHFRMAAKYGYLGIDIAERSNGSE